MAAVSVPSAPAVSGDGLAGAGLATGALVAAVAGAGAVANVFVSPTLTHCPCVLSRYSDQGGMSAMASTGIRRVQGGMLSVVWKEGCRGKGEVLFFSPSCSRGHKSDMRV